MSTQVIIFFILAFGCLAGAGLALYMSCLVRSTLALVFTALNVAGLFFLMHAPFLGFVMILVYIGAVALLFLFVVMTLPRDEAGNRNLKLGWKTIFPGIVLLCVFYILLARDANIFKLMPALQAQISSIRQIGQVLYTTYFIPFQLTGLLLLVGVLGAIILVWSPLQGQRRQRRRKQHLETAGSRLELVDLPKQNSPKGEGGL